MLFSFQSKEWKRPVRLFSLCPFVSILSTLQDGWCRGEGVLPFPAGNKSLEGKFAGVQHFSSPLLMKPSWCFSLHNLFQQMLGAVDERQSLAHTPGPHGRGAGQRVEPTLSSQGLTHCTLQPSQRLLVSCCPEPADNRGPCPLLHFWNECAAPARAEADAQDGKWLHHALPRVKLFRGAKVPVCHRDREL